MSTSSPTRRTGRGSDAHPRPTVAKSAKGGKSGKGAQRSARTPKEAVLLALRQLAQQRRAESAEGVVDERALFFTPTEVQRHLNAMGYTVGRPAVSIRLSTLAEAGEIVGRPYADLSSGRLAEFNRMGFRYALKGDDQRDYSHELQQLLQHAGDAALSVKPRAPRRHVAPGHRGTQLQLRDETARKLSAAATALGIERDTLADQLLADGLAEVPLDQVHQNVQRRYPPLSQPRENAAAS